MNKCRKKNDMASLYLPIMNQWLILKQNNINLCTYLVKKGYYRVGIYGIGIYGRHLIREFLNTEVEVLYGIDIKSMKPYMEVPIYKLAEIPYQADVIINTVFYDNELKTEIERITNCEVLSFEELVFESFSHEDSRLSVQI